MGLIEEYIEVTLSSSNINHYESFGYDIPRVKNKFGKFVVPRGTKIRVKTTELMSGSSEKVHIKCDHCGKIIKIYYYTYSNYNHNGLYYCNDCSSTVLESGENNPRWNHTITKEERENKRACREYSDFIKSVLIRDDYTCQCCGKKNNGKQDVHHLDGYNWCVEKRFDQKNGITLCRNCHSNFHALYGKGNNTKEQFEEWIGKTIKTTNNIELYPNRKIYCLETGIIYNDSSFVCSEIGVNRSNVATHCNAYKNLKQGKPIKLKSLKGLHFLWYDEFLHMSTDDISNYLISCKNNHNRKVICITTNKTFNTIKEGANYYNLKSTIGITNCCRGESSYSGKLEDGTKLIWMYYEDYQAYKEKMLNGF